MYIMISMIISVISAAVNISTSAMKLFRNARNLESLFFGLSELRSFLSRIFFLFLYRTAKSRSVLRALIKYGLILNVLSDMGQNLFLCGPI